MGLKPAVDLKSLLPIEELRLHETRPPQYAAENAALVSLVQELATSPDRILQKLVDTALVLCRAHSAGVSLFDDDRKNFYWPVIAGAWAPHHVGGGTPADFGPCGTVCDLDATLLFARPSGARFTVRVPIVEAQHDPVAIEIDEPAGASADEGER